MQKNSASKIILISIAWLFLVTIIFSSISCGSKSSKEHILKELKAIADCPDTNFTPIYNIPLSEELIDDPKAREELFQVTQKYDDYKIARRKDAERDEKEQKGEDITPFDKEEYRDLVRVIVKYPQSKSALTAKLRIGGILVWPSSTRSYALTILQEIKSYYPDSWQAIFASAIIGTVYYLDAKSDKEKTMKVIQYYLKDIEYYKKLDMENDPEFKQLKIAKQIGRAHV